MRCPHGKIGRRYILDHLTYWRRCILDQAITVLWETSIPPGWEAGSVRKLSKLERGEVGEKGNWDRRLVTKTGSTVCRVVQKREMRHVNFLLDCFVDPVGAANLEVSENRAWHWLHWRRPKQTGDEFGVNERGGDAWCGKTPEVRPKRCDM